MVVGKDSDAALAAAHLGVSVAIEPRLLRALRPVQDGRAFLALRARVRREQVDVVITHQSKAGVLGRLAARSAGRVPAVHSLSMANFGPGYGRVESLVFRMIEWALAPITARYVCVGADLARRFEIAGIASDALTIVRSGASLPSPRPAHPPAVPGIPDGRPVIVCLGALEPRKNPLDLVPLLAQVRRAVPDAFLAVAGSGPQAGALEERIRAAGLSDHVALLGYVSPVDPLFWRADALVLLSTAEGLPQVLMQGAAAGVPFVSYEVDGARELIGLGARGTVVALGDVGAAARALVGALSEPGIGVRTVDVSSWETAVIQASYRRVIDGVLELGPQPNVGVPVEDRRRVG